MIANPKLQAFVSWDECETGLLYPGEAVLWQPQWALCGDCAEKLPSCLLSLPPAELSAELPSQGWGWGWGLKQTSLSHLPSGGQNSE